MMSHWERKWDSAQAYLSSPGCRGFDPLLGVGVAAVVPLQFSHTRAQTRFTFVRRKIWDARSLVGLPADAAGATRTSAQRLLAPRQATQPVHPNVGRGMCDLRHELAERIRYLQRHCLIGFDEFP